MLSLYLNLIFWITINTQYLSSVISSNYFKIRDAKNILNLFIIMHYILNILTL
jgi:hypothetical protein